MNKEIKKGTWCKFWDADPECFIIGKLKATVSGGLTYPYYNDSSCSQEAEPLTKEDISKLIQDVCPEWQMVRPKHPNGILPEKQTKLIKVRLIKLTDNYAWEVINNTTLIKEFNEAPFYKGFCDIGTSDAWDNIQKEIQQLFTVERELKPGDMVAVSDGQAIGEKKHLRRYVGVMSNGKIVTENNLNTVPIAWKEIIKPKHAIQPTEEPHPDGGIVITWEAEVNDE